MPSLPTAPALNLAAVRAISAAAEAEAAAHGWAVAIAVVDHAGQLLHFLRMDGCSNASIETALAKARHAIHFRRSTKFHEDRLSEGLMVVLSLPGALPLEGGVPLLAGAAYVGAIGVSGVQSAQDGQIAQAGVDALQRWLGEA